MAKAVRARLTQEGVDRVRSGHLWVFKDHVMNLDRLIDRPVVTIGDKAGSPLGTAFLSRSSRIALRVLARRVEDIDLKFWRNRIRDALEIRKRPAIPGNAYRLLHGEADLVPSVIVDRYGPYLVAQFLSAGADAVKGDIVQALADEISPKGILERSDRALRQREGLSKSDGVLAGEVPRSVEIEQNGLKFHVDLERGQKTGWFLDQRENYLAAKRWARGSVADCFCYAGGFALHAASSDAVNDVFGIDSSAQALERASDNAAVNQITKADWIKSDCFEWLKTQSDRRKRFDTVILDPPAFAKTRSGLAGAHRGYKEINLRAMTILSRGGILITCSCSHHVSPLRFEGILRDAAYDAKRRLQILEKRFQPPDHPILASMPETAYLKCYVCRVL